MPPFTRSRFSFSLGIRDAAGKMYLTDYEPFAYQAFPSNIMHVCTDDQTLQGIADLYFSPLPDAALLWWIIADFQPQPIRDPTLRLVAGQTLVIPSMQVVLDKIFSETRRAEMGL